MIRIGTSGWMYDDWIESFYPKNIDKKNFLSFYSKNFDTVEVNNTFYSLPSKRTIKNWREKVSSDFLFSVKASRYITHMKNLLEPKESVDKMFERIKLLGDKLGPILFQLPPRWKVNKKRLKNFIKVLPNNYKFIFEFRDKSWYREDIFKLLKKEKCSLCIHDHKDAPSPLKLIGDSVYIRFHGPGGFYSSKYKNETLRKWAKDIKNWDKKGFDVFAYFNNDISGFAIENTKTLKSYLTEVL